LSKELGSAPTYCRHAHDAALTYARVIAWARRNISSENSDKMNPGRAM